MVDLLNRLKIYLGIKDNIQDELLEHILESTEQRLLSRLNTDNVPEQLEYILVEVAVKRFNRIGSEGMTNKSLEGLSTTFKDDDFAEFESDIKIYVDGHASDEDGVVLFY